MGRPRTGTKRLTADGFWQARLTLNDGRQEWARPFRRRMTEQEADVLAAELSERAVKENWSAIPEEFDTCRETVSTWFSRWSKYRQSRGVASWQDDVSRFEQHIEPLIGRLPVREVTREQLERLVRKLEAKV